MKVLITGATGLIGTRLSELLAADGHIVNYLTHSKISDDNNHIGTGFHWDPKTCKIDENAFIGVEAIIHLAGASIAERWTDSYKQDIIESRILSANLLYKVLKNNPHTVTRFISASAIGIYPGSLNKRYTEDSSAVDDSFLGTVVTKWEESVDKIKSLGIVVSKVRTGLVLSERGGMLTEIMKPTKLGLGTGFGSGKQWQSWIHLDDIAGIYKFLLTSKAVGVFNGVAPNPVTNNHLTKAMANVMDKPYFLPNVPKFVMQVVLGEMHILLYDSQKVSAEKILDAGYGFEFVELDRALEELLK